MNWVDAVAIVVYAVGAFTFGTVLVVDRGPVRGLPGDHDDGPIRGRRLRRVGTALNAACMVWFLVAIGVVIALHSASIDANWFHLATAAIAYLFPALIMHVNHAGRECSGADVATAAWRLPYRILYVTGTACFLYVLGIVLWDWAVPGVGGNLFINGTIGIQFVLAGLYSILISRSSRRLSENPTERSNRRWTNAVYAGMIVFFAAMMIGALADGRALYGMRLVGSSLPLAFLAIGRFHDDRFEFLDRYVKGTINLVTVLLVLVAWASAVMPAIAGLELGSAEPWVQALAILPLLGVIPWVHRRMSTWLDERWFGRQFPPLEAVKRFLAGLRDADGEADLVAIAERGLGGLFDAPARVVLGPTDGDDVDGGEVRVPIGSGPDRVGTLVLGRRRSGRPYFSEDRALLDSLSDVFLSMLEHVRMRRAREEHERIARELTLQASRSELKALRAQINPHFLFNALNAIAGLIHRDPMRADRTVEQLAEIFRYTLRGSDREWATVGDEIEYAEAYLDVERARFGDRMSVEVEVEPAIRAARIPALTVRTLVENAVKHGVARVTGPVRIEIRAEHRDGDVVVEVRDSGPGPDRERPTAAQRGTGFGLRNVRERLRGHYQDRASVTLERIDAEAVTVATLRLPSTPEAKAAEGA